MSVPRNTATGIPISVAMSAGMQIPVNPERPIRLPSIELRGVVIRHPTPMADTVATPQMSISSITQEKRRARAE